MMPTSHKLFGLFGAKSSQETEDLESLRDITDDVIEADFVPYACLFDPHSIATKNGEILQIIRLSGITAQGVRVEDLRGKLRDAISKHIPNTQYAFWIHTMRRRAPLMPPDRFPDSTSQTIDSHWRAAHAIDEYYVNELYVTVVRAGHPTGADAAPQREFIRSLWPPADMKLRAEVMESARMELEQTVTNMMADLHHYGAHRLGIAERDGVMYGEHLEFLEQLINLKARPMPVPQEDLSEYLTSGDVTFGFNAMEVRTADGERRFAAILTIKEYKEVSLQGLDEFLEIPCELIVTQCFDFIGAKQARNEYQKQAHYMRLSGDAEMAQWSEVDALTRDDGLGERAFGQQQTSLFMIAPTVKALEDNIQKVRRALRRLGIVSVREDLRFEEMYWAQLPANFLFIARHNSVNTMHLAGFVKLARPPLGNSRNSAWGAPLIIFRNAQRRPCFFSFFDSPKPHTTIIAKRGRGRASFTHMLLAHTRKWQGSRIWMMDTQSRSTPFMESMGAHMVHLGREGASINPFQLENTPSNREFLVLWATMLLDPSGQSTTPSRIQFFKEIIAALMECAPEERSVATLVAMATQRDASLAEIFAAHLRDPITLRVFNQLNDALQMQQNLCVNLAELYQHAHHRTLIASYILHRMTDALDGTPTIIVLDEAFILFNNPIFAPRVAAWLAYVQSKNAVVIMGTSDVAASAETGIVASAMAEVGHRFMFADHSPEQAYLDHFGISEDAFAILPEFGGDSRMVLHQDHAGQLQLYQTQMPLSEELHMLLAGTAKPKPKRNSEDIMAGLTGDAA
jgi:type IV secretion system protein VirB4